MKKSSVRLSRQPLRKVSEKRKGENKVYAKLREEFLSREQNRWCPVVYELHGLREETTEIHHCFRRGKHFLDTKTWLAVCRAGHLWIEAHPNDARKMGFLCDTAETRARWLAKNK